MIRSICRGLALAVCSLSVVSAAPRQQDDQSGMPMRFVAHQQSAAAGCVSHCRLLITASGLITADTPRDFDDFLHDRDIRGATIVLDSKGGSLLGAIALGREIRRLGLATTIGRVREQVGHEGASRRVRVSPNAECHSMCPFVLLGGVNRYVPPEARVLVHQVWLGDRRDDAVAASYSAEDLMLVQQDIGELMQYTMEMGGSAELLEMALRVPPWEPMRMLSRDEVRRARLDTSQDRAGQAPASSGASDPTAASWASERTHRAFAGTQGWLMAPREGGSALVRRHPLTIEGEQIGAFEVALACGQTSGAYLVTYDETRRSVDEHDAASLTQVDLVLDGKMATLDIVSSGASATPHTLETRASGVLSANLVKSFADTPGDSMTVRTVSSNGPGTRIRVGNAGFVSAFRALAATCGRVPVAATDIHADLSANTPRVRSRPDNAAAGSLLSVPSHHLENGSAGRQ